MGKILVKQSSKLFLKVVILLIAIGTLIWMIWFPQLEGRATNLDLISIYKDPLIIYGYIASIPFFVALYYAFKFLGIYTMFASIVIASTAAIFERLLQDAVNIKSENDLTAVSK